jgi:hypothetical protein
MSGADSLKELAAAASEPKHSMDHTGSGIGGKPSMKRPAAKLVSSAGKTSMKRRAAEVGFCVRKQTGASRS